MKSAAVFTLTFLTTVVSAQRKGFFQNLATGKCLDVAGWYPDNQNNGQKIQQATCDWAARDTTDQVFQVNDNGTLSSANMKKHMCLDIPGFGEATKFNLELQLWECDAKAPDQRWTLVSDAFYQDVMQIKDMHGKCLDVVGHASCFSGQPVQTYPCETFGGSGGSWSDQFWRFVEV